MNTETDEQHFTDLYQRHYGSIEAYVRRRVHPDAVRDVVADVFLTAWRRIEEVPGSLDALPWLYGVARRTLANSRRSEARRQNLVQVLAGQPTGTVTDHADTVSEQLALAAAFDGLSHADQEVLRLALWEQLPPDQAAKVLGCRVATFRVRLHRARKRLLRGAADVPEHESNARSAPGLGAMPMNWSGSDA
ncbi:MULTISPECIES: sigma-70 family RNA polymerase sigma factor [unclassified Streptomyces]|uniref:RNA polymerase sigma factor n=1 Tax=unclassified Streptomyces TaxID=2593676 RepID=UPI002366AFE5|nr:MULTISPECIES: sigma-70 family RNA polymerase sigma factor [unclassified Streptomyces]MDF3139977.1 sigma-70 family RNA polymerase sigma factor [Streptomyces sp. T21Q-yed]WDF39884.1 sigma-70 family RNA polymerase sigma factor [Streptomyces sp. T12]